MRDISEEEEEGENCLNNSNEIALCSTSSLRTCARLWHFVSHALHDTMGYQLFICRRSFWLYFPSFHCRIFVCYAPKLRKGAETRRTATYKASRKIIIWLCSDPGSLVFRVNSCDFCYLLHIRALSVCVIRAKRLSVCINYDACDSRSKHTHSHTYRIDDGDDFVLCA